MYLSICATMGERAKASDDSTASSSARSAWRSQSAGISPRVQPSKVYHPCAAWHLHVIDQWPFQLLRQVTVHGAAPNPGSGANGAPEPSAGACRKKVHDKKMVPSDLISSLAHYR